MLDPAFLLACWCYPGGSVLLIIALVTQGVGRAGIWTTVLGAGLAIPGALVTLVACRLKQRGVAGDPARSDQVARRAQELQAVAWEQWRQEVKARSLGDLDPMPMGWRLSDPAVMDHDGHIASTRLRFAGGSDRMRALTDQFRESRRRRLVIISNPGLGKTTLAVRLLLEGWQPGVPVLVLFALAGRGLQIQPRVQDWLAGQLARTYSGLWAFGAGAVQKPADEGLLLPVLDGLDEIPTERRGVPVRAVRDPL